MFQVDDDIVQVAVVVGGFSRDNAITISCSKWSDDEDDDVGWIWVELRVNKAIGWEYKKETE